MASRKEIVERELGVSIPEQYALFLERYGIYNEGADEVYGLNESLRDWDGIPCVIGATKLVRAIEGLAQHMLVIHDTGYEGELVLLDTRDGTIHLMEHPETHKIADSFDEWFEREILSSPEETD